MNKLFQDLPELFARLFEAANKNVLPFQWRMDQYNTNMAPLVAMIDKKEKEIEYLAAELANSEAQLNGIFKMGDRMKYVLNAACHYGAITETEWNEHLREHLENIQALIQYQMGLSAGSEQNVENCQTALDEARNNKEMNESKLARATEWWQVITKIANTAFNHRSELEQPQQTAENFRYDVLETYTNLRHDLDVALYLAQLMIDEHSSQREEMIEINRRLNKSYKKLRGLCEQKERNQALGAKMSQWIGRFFGGADANVQQQEHDLDMEAIMTPLQDKIDKTRSEVAEFEQSQKELLYLIVRKEPEIEEYKEVVEQLMEVRAVVEEVVTKCEIEDVD